MIEIWLYTLASVLVISLLSLIGVFTISIKTEKLKSFLIYFVSFSAGALFGGAFLHLLPEIVEEVGFGINVSLSVLGGIIIFFLIEKVVHWNHCHLPITKTHVHPFSIMNLVGDAFHNFIDGLIIGASYLVNTSVGIATSIAVILHEIPQEISDFGVLLHGGFSKKKALFMNFIVSLFAVLGAVIALILGSFIENITTILIPLAAGGFIYVAGSDLIPELHKECATSRSITQMIFFILGILIMYLLLLIG